ncbi:MAG TPA: gamma-glutamyl-gamma-aminobutyrate hydrolase family protein [Rubrobacter sp.]|nr:gamma-glutamyl-gamma-aminobutyrate hydrolase family protein [Rubrobacter sp.]
MNPALYGQHRHPETGPIQDERDAYEIALVRKALERELPMETGVISVNSNTSVRVASSARTPSTTSPR